MKEQRFKTISKELLSLALPMAITQLIAVGSGFLCMAMISGLGRDYLAASALIFSARISIIITGSSILFALSILIGHAYGQGEHHRIGNFTQQGWVLGLLISIPVMIIFWHMSTVLNYLHQPKELTDIVAEFFHVNIWNVIPFILSISTQQLLYGTKKQRIDLIANTLAFGLLVLSAYTFIFGKFGVPKLGIAGLAYALNLQGWFYFLFTSIVLYSDTFFKRFKLFELRFHQQWSDLVTLFKIGWPICVQIGSELLYLLASAAMVGWVGVNALAAYQIVSQYFFLVIVPVFAIAQANGVLVGHSLGEKSYAKIMTIAYAGILFSLIITVSAAVVFLIFPSPLASVYLDVQNPENAGILHLVILLFAIFSINLIVDGVRNVVTGALRGLFDTQFPMYIAVLAIWVIGVPLGYALAFPIGLGVSGIVIGTTLGVFLGMVILLRRWHVFNKKIIMQ